MSDCINRQEAIEAILNSTIRVADIIPHEYCDELPECIIYERNAVLALALMPSCDDVTNTQGYWQWKSDDSVWKCSKCGTNPTKGMGYVQLNDELFKYCPYCGAKMG